MWAISNDTPYAAERCFVRDRDGSEIWLVAVRATYDFTEDGAVALAKEQSPAALAPEWTAEPGASSLLWDTDFVRTKLGTDVLLHGSAHAPARAPTTELLVGLAVGPVNKRLRVIGDRVYRRGITGVEPDERRPFTTMPICYERAFGGRSVDLKTGQLKGQQADNPVGRGFAPVAGQPCHNIEYPVDLQRSVLASTRPASFGPIPGNWQPRLGLAGTYGKAWEDTRQPLLPIDFRDEFYSSAPADQRVPGHLRGGERVLLYNLTPQGLTQFELPRVRLGFTTTIQGVREHHRGTLHSVIIMSDLRRLIMVWHTALPCHHGIHTLKQTQIYEKKRLGKHEPESAGALR